MMTEFKENLMKDFEMINSGLMNYFLDVEVKQQEKAMFIC